MARQFGIPLQRSTKYNPVLPPQPPDWAAIVTLMPDGSYTLALHPAYELDKSFSTARWDRKYFWSTSGSRMSASDKVDPLSVLRGAEILCIEKSVLDMVAE